MTRKTRQCLVKFLRGALGGRRSYNGSERLAVVDNITTCCLYRTWLAIICDVRDRNGLGTTPNTLAKVINCLGSLCVKTVLTTLDAMDSWLLRTTYDTSQRTISALKQSITHQGGDGGFGDIIIALLTPVVQRYCRQLDADTFRDAHQVFAFMKRLSLKKVNDLKKVAYDAWLEAESSIGNYEGELPEQDLLSKWFPEAEELELMTKHFSPKHSGGAVAEGRLSKSEKFMVATPSYDAVAYLATTGILTSLCGGETMAQAIDWHMLVFLDSAFTNQVRNMNEVWSAVNPGYARVIFVPKSWKTFRTISAEPAGAMFIQQGVGAVIDYVLRTRRSGLSRYYCLDTEWRNRDLAWKGSISGRLATLDLSFASDMVPAGLTRRLLQHTWLLKPAFACRTDRVLVRDPYTGNDRIVALKKFAPMGNRLTFPIETMIFAAVAVTVFVQVYNRMPTSEEVAVYGDDIVVPQEIAEKVMDRLVELGFRVNRDKSFWQLSDHHFRESCGGEYYDGADVTPVRVSRFFQGFPSGEAPASGLIASCMSFANNLCSFPTARALVISALRKYDVLFDSTGERGVFAVNPRNHQASARWYEPYQEEQIRVWQLGAKEQQSIASSWAEPFKLYEWLRVNRHDSSITGMFEEEPVRLKMGLSDPVARYKYISESLI